VPGSLIQERHLRLVEPTDPVASTAPVEPTGTGDVAAALAAVLAEATEDLMTDAPLALPLALSVCMAHHDTGTEDLIALLRSLRGAILTVSGLDPRSEPVPLVAGEPRRAALGMAEHVRGLLTRASRACAAAPDVVAHAAAAQLA
jgi:hypothetical protein